VKVPGCLPAALSIRAGTVGEHRRTTHATVPVCVRYRKPHGLCRSHPPHRWPRLSGRRRPVLLPRWGRSGPAFRRGTTGAR
tara:strand:+ start:142884 stop:143126 length:243 start_codon:yes stop_codon:yes gene_type:complete